MIRDHPRSVHIIPNHPRSFQIIWDHSGSFFNHPRSFQIIWIIPDHSTGPDTQQTPGSGTRQRPWCAVTG